jgi:hypothetical protein
MLDRIEKLLVRKLRGVFGERDPARRATAIEVIFDRDCLFSDARRRHVGHRELEDTVVALQVRHCHVKQVEAIPLARREGLSYWNHSVRLPFVLE